MNEILQKRIEEAASHYLLHEHKSPLNEILHQCDLKTEMQYHRDIEQAYIEGGKNSLQNQWISVDEALPEKNIMCLVRKETEVGIIYDTDYIDYEGKWFFNFNRASIKSMAITHWMSIPELKGGEK